MKYVLPEYPQVVWMVPPPIPTPLFRSLSPSETWGSNRRSGCPETWKRNKLYYSITGLQYHAFLFKLGVNLTFMTCYQFGVKFESSPYPKVTPIPIPLFRYLSASDLWGNNPWSDCPVMWKRNRSCYWITLLQDHGFLFKLSVNIHLQAVTCLGKIWVPWVSTSGLDGAVSHPDWCSWVPLSPCPLGKYSLVLLTWDVKEKQKLLLNYRPTVPCISVNEHLQWVTCLGEICVTPVSTSGYDGAASNPDCWMCVCRVTQ